MKWIGWAVLWPWMKYRFASRRMTPRFDDKGRVYMLLCDLPSELAKEE